MNNVRGLYPPLYGATPSGGGGGGGQHIQVDALPEASLDNKNKIVQYTGTTTETLTNGFFYKCVENTTYDWEETEASETYTEADTLPTASAETIGTIYKVDDKYYQTVIVLTYSWVNIPVMEVESGGGVNFDTTETVIGTYKGKDLYARVFENLEDQIDVSSIRIDRIIGCFYNFMRSNGLEGYITPHASYYSTIRYAVTNGIVTSMTPTNTGGTVSIVLLYTKAN